jgi:hypothetical protein
MRQGRHSHKLPMTPNRLTFLYATPFNLLLSLLKNSRSLQRIAEVSSATQKRGCGKFESHSPILEGG